MIVSFFVAIFVGIAQLLTSADVIQLTPAQMVRIWLTVAGLVVLLAAVDMICRAYVTAKKFGMTQASLAPFHVAVDVDAPGAGPGGPHTPAELVSILPGGPDSLVQVHYTGGPEKDTDALVPVSRVHLPVN